MKNVLCTYSFLLFFFLLSSSSKIFAQNIAINETGDSPDTSAMLDINSVTKGLLMPRVTTTQQNSIPLPAKGLLLFNTTDSAFKFNIGSASVPSWIPLLSNTTGWTLTGNNSIASSTQFFGTLNNASLRFKTYNTERMVLDSNGRLGLGTAVPSNILSFGGNSTRTIWMERNTVGGTDGSDLIIQSGGAYTGGTNLNGGDMYIEAGTSTGTGSSDVYIQTSTAGTAGSADNIPSTKMSILGNGNVGIGITPSAILHLKAGTTSANAAPLKFTSGVSSQSTKEAGAVNYDGSDLTISDNTYAYTLDKSLTGSATLDFPSTGSLAVSDLTITVTGAATGDVVLLGVPNGSVTATGIYSAWVSAANTVKIRFSAKGLLEDPASGTFKVRVIK